MQLTFLETLLAVHRFGSFSTAAQSRNMTLSALSMQMKALEEDLGVRLFDRQFRPPKLTPIGEKIAREAQAVVQAQARLRSHCAVGDALNGQFHVGFVNSVAARSLSAFLRHAKTRAPAAQFSFETGLSEVVCEGVRMGRLDAAIATDIAEATAGLITHALFQEEMVLIMPRSDGASEHDVLGSALPFFHFMPKSGIGRLIAQFLEQRDARPRKTVVLDNIEAITTCVGDGLGYSILPKQEVDRYGQGRIRSVSWSPRPFFRTISLVTRADPLSDIWRDPLRALAQASV
ncbi:MAG: LysR family transcriptional regulator, partial [Pseudomonadota bacterium]